MFAATHDDPALIDYLLRQGVNVAQQAPNGVTALMIAAAAGRRRAAERLVAAGADVRLTQAEGLDAAALARRRGHARLAELLEGAKGEGAAPE